MSLFTWLKFKFAGKNGSRYDVYQPSERLIYVYWDGEKQIKADPMVLYKKIMAMKPDLMVDMKLSLSEHSGASKAYEEMLANIRLIFSLKKFEEGGLTETETMGLFDHFLDYCNTVKKNSRKFQTSSNSLEDSRYSSRIDQTTTNSSVSGFVETAASSAAPEPLNSGPK